MRYLTTFFVLAIALLISVPARQAMAAPSAELWEKWAVHDAASTRVIDHGSWDNLLAVYLQAFKSNTKRSHGVNLVDYGRLKASDQKRLEAYVVSLSGLKISDYNRDQQLAYWINLYNALTVQAIVQNYPVETIKDISSGFFFPGPWRKKLVRVENQKLTLNDIEHRILRPIWKDPRIHYAVNCAAMGCPNLQDKAFTADSAEAMLEQAAKEYVNHPRGATVSDGRLRVSSIYKWYKADFGGDDIGILMHLRQYANHKLSSDLEGISRISGDDYDWSLNDTTQASARHKKKGRRGLRGGGS